jgi:hypothetical protein
LNSSNGEWMTTMPEQLNMEWVDSVKVLIWNFNSFEFKLPLSLWYFTYTDDPVFSAYFWVFHWKNTSVTFWRKGSFTCMELQTCRYLSCD